LEDKPRGTKSEMMPLGEEQINKIVIDYIDENIYNYAVLIDGGWGSGKTFLVRNSIIPSIEEHERRKKEKEKEYQERKAIYVSLYGIANETDISKQIYTSMLSKSEKGKKTAGIATRIISDLSEKFLIKFDIIELLENVFQSKKYILIFDDLERCGIDINRVLGYINSFVEHDGIKTIIIANQAEIGASNFWNNLELKYILAVNNSIDFPEKAKDPFEKGLGLPTLSNKQIKLDEVNERAKQLFSENFQYSLIKEKLIGVTIHYEPNLKKVITALIDKYILHPAALATLKRKAPDLIEFMDAHHYNNLRSLQSAIHNFNLICAAIGNLEIKEYLFNDLLMYCVFSTVRNKLGKPIPDWKDTEAGFVPFDSTSFNLLSTSEMQGFKFIDEMVYYSKRDDASIRSCIQWYIEYQDKAALESTDPITILGDWVKQTDDGARSLVDVMIKK